MTDWDAIRRHKLSPERPPEWPEGIRAISMEGMTLMGIHEKTGRLYWDGKEVVTRSKIRLGTFELWVVSIAAAGTFGTFLVEAGRSIGWWH